MRLFFLILVAFLSTRLQAFAAPAPAPNGWLLRMTSDEQGMLETRLTKDSLRIDTEDCTLLIVPPNYDMYLYNAKNKRYLQLPQSAFSKHTTLRAQTASKYTLTKSSQQDMCGMKTTKFITSDKQGPCFEFWATDQFGVPQKLCDACVIFMSFNELPPGHGMPLRADRISSSGGRLTHIRTRSIDRAYIAPDVFTKPKNFERVANFVSLRTNSSNMPVPASDALDYMRDFKDK